MFCSLSLTVMSVVFTPPRPASSVAVTTKLCTLASASKSFAAASAPFAVRVITPVVASIANQPLSLPDLML
ncbi:Uncharacterised protein [Vibrio cholerae]|nr:Uncharacterised protein [Vibrio cholerae]CSI77596.1 Uncharacterised protein [Vibrio cholerae]